MPHFRFVRFMMILCLFLSGCAGYVLPTFYNIHNPILLSKNTGANPAITMDTVRVFEAKERISVWRGGYSNSYRAGKIIIINTYTTVSIEYENNLRSEAIKACQNDRNKAIIYLKYYTENTISLGNSDDEIKLKGIVVKTVNSK